MHSTSNTFGSDHFPRHTNKTARHSGICQSIHILFCQKAFHTPHIFYTLLSKKSPYILCTCCVKTGPNSLFHFSPHSSMFLESDDAICISLIQIYTLSLHKNAHTHTGHTQLPYFVYTISLWRNFWSITLWNAGVLRDEIERNPWPERELRKETLLSMRKIAIAV